MKEDVPDYLVKAKRYSQEAERYSRISERYILLALASSSISAFATIMSLIQQGANIEQQAIIKGSGSYAYKGMALEQSTPFHLNLVSVDKKLLDRDNPDVKELLDKIDSACTISQIPKLRFMRRFPITTRAGNCLSLLV